MSDQNFEIPQSLREVAEKNVEQARQAYERFLEASRQAQDMVAQSSEAMSANAKKVQQKALEFTRENMKQGFDLAERLAKAKNLQEAFEIQSSYARQQIETYSRQARELVRLMGEGGRTTS